MPTYEYQCRACNHRFETWQKMIDEPLTICPECGERIRRVLFPAGVVFKGHGFYKTDHAAIGTAGENGHTTKSEGAESTTKEAETKTSSESKPAKSTSSDTSSTKSKAGESKVPVETK